MGHTIQPRQVYQACCPFPLGPATLFISAYEPGAPVAEAVDANTGAACVVYADDLHATPLTPTGDSRLDGYALIRRHVDNVPPLAAW
ncbi:hypothetical protein [Streptomyces rhizosphaericus]|uniref:hypothetical protein n=1 Tax=Streptomyces rhizosphaericus TaxID=114699 RepID=UPI000A39EEF2|nr:hypothetical protein [Streptomyces rhizosphaericus]